MQLRQILTDYELAIVHRTQVQQVLQVQTHLVLKSVALIAGTCEIISLMHAHRNLAIGSSAFVN